MTGGRLRVGLIGAGMVSQHHLKAWARIDTAEVIAIADPDLAKARRRAKEFGVPGIYAGGPEMMDAIALDAIDIAAPVGVHGELCRAAASRNLPVLCQKPLSETAADAVAIADDVGRRTRLMVHENWRYRPTYQLASTWLEAGRIGKPRTVTMQVRSSGLVRDADGDYPALRRQPFMSGMPRLIVFELLVHHFDVLGWLFGALTVKSARLWRECPRVIGDDNADIRLTAAGGMPLRLQATFTDPSAPAHIADDLTVEGEEGTIRISDSHADLATSQPESKAWPVDEIYAASYEGALREFHDAITAGRAFRSTPKQHIECLKLVEQVYSLAGRF